MATKLKRSLFIGLGGTGMKSILKTKRLYKEAFGEVPGIIGFLGLDTSTEEFAKVETTEDGQEIRLEKYEQCSLSVKGPLDHYTNHKESFEWLPDKNVDALSGLSANGAGQIRTNGRFAFSLNYGKVRSDIREAVNRVTSALNDGGDQWELVQDKVQIYLVTSLSGGTGCGIFLNVAFLIRDLYEDNVVLQAYAVLPNAFEGRGAYVGANCYGALLDLDYLMTTINPANPFHYTVYDEDFQTNKKPFDMFYLVDNANDLGDSYNDDNQLYTMIGHALLAISGSIGSASTADLDNFRQTVIDGSLDVEDKKSWVCGLGLCEIIIDTERLRLRYGLKAGAKLVQDMIGTADVDTISEVTNAWITKNQLLEHEDDQLINSLYDVTQLPAASIISSKVDSAVAEKDAYISDTITRVGNDIQSAGNTRLAQVKESFAKRLMEVAETKGGLSASKAFITKLTDALNLYAKEMEQEQVELKAKSSPLKSEVEDAVVAWKEKPFYRGSQPYIDALCEAMGLYVRNEVEILRRNKAYQFFIDLKQHVLDSSASIDEALKRLDSVGELLREELSNIEFSKEANPFQIDLAKNYAVDGTSDADCTISKFVEFNKGMSLLKLKDFRTDQIIKMVKSFTATLNGANRYNSLSLEKLILDMDAEEKKKIFEKALRKSEVLLEVSDRGYQQTGLRNALYISIIGGKDGKLATDDVLVNVLGAEAKPTFAAAPTNKRIMIFRQKGVFPVFKISTVLRRITEYDKYTNHKAFTFDRRVDEEIAALHFGFMPNQKKETDVLEMWVKGLIHGFIKREGQRYVVQSKSLSNNDKTNDYWVKLRAPEENKGTEARWYAFEDFKSKKRELKQTGDLYTKIHEKEENMGREAIKALYGEIASLSANDYVEKYSCTNVALNTLRTSLSYVNTLNVIKDELSYIEEHLLESIQ